MIKLKKHRRAGTVEEALLMQWRALAAAQEALYSAAESGSAGDVLRAVHAITQASAGYAKLWEAHQLEARVTALEEAQRRQDSMRRAA